MFWLLSKACSIIFFATKFMFFSSGEWGHCTLRIAPLRALPRAQLKQIWEWEMLHWCWLCAYWPMVNSWLDSIASLGMGHVLLQTNTVFQAQIATAFPPDIPPEPLIWMQRVAWYLPTFGVHTTVGSHCWTSMRSPLGSSVSWVSRAALWKFLMACISIEGIKVSDTVLAAISWCPECTMLQCIALMLSLLRDIKKLIWGSHSSPTSTSLYCLFCLFYFM